MKLFSSENRLFLWFQISDGRNLYVFSLTQTWLAELGRSWKTPLQCSALNNLSIYLSLLTCSTSRPTLFVVSFGKKNGAGRPSKCGATSPSLVLGRAVWTWFCTTVIDHSKGRSFWSGTGVKVRLTMARLNYVIIHWLIEWGNMCAFQKLKTGTGPKYHSLFPPIKRWLV